MAMTMIMTDNSEEETYKLVFKEVRRLLAHTEIWGMALNRDDETGQFTAYVQVERSEDVPPTLAVFGHSVRINCTRVESIIPW